MYMCMAWRRSRIVRVSIVTLVCCAAVAVASADLTVDPEAELPHVEGPTEVQVLELRTFTPEQQARFFHEARLALNVTDVGSENVTFASDYDLSKGPHGDNLGWYLHRGTASLYARLPKCANNAIALMLFAQYGGRKLSVDELRETVKPEKKWGSLNRQAFTQDNSGLVALRGDTYQLPPASTDSFKPVISRTWTFVRDPLSHFVSAYTEASTRMHMKRLRKGAKFKPCTIKTFMNFLEKLLTGSIRSILRNEAYHLYPMSELAIDQPRVAVGHMAHFQEHWEAVQTWLGQEQVIPWNRSISAVAKHVSSSDPLGTTAAAKTAISKNPAVQRALCFLLLPDFINFGYTLPPECKEDGRMTTLLQWLDGPKEMVKASSQRAGPRPTVEELDSVFQSARTRLASGGKTPPHSRRKKRRKKGKRKGKGHPFLRADLHSKAAHRLHGQ